MKLILCVCGPWYLVKQSNSCNCPARFAAALCEELCRRDFTNFAHKVSPTGYTRADLLNAAHYVTFTKLWEDSISAGFSLTAVDGQVIHVSW